MLAAVSRALEREPGRRPGAGTLAAELRIARTRQRRPAQRRPAAKPKAEAPRAVPLEAQVMPAALAGAAALVGGLLLPFWPPGLIAALALAAALATLRAPRIGLALALFVPVFPLGNVAAAAAFAYGALALGWLALSWRDPRAGLAFCAGPLLAGVGALALLPLAVQPARGALRHALHAAAGVLAAVAVAGLRGGPLPISGATAGDLGIAGSEQPLAVATAVGRALAEQGGLLGVAVVLAAAAAVLPAARSRGPRWIAGLGAAQLAALLAVAPHAWPSIVLGTAALCATLAVRAPR